MYLFILWLGVTCIGTSLTEESSETLDRQSKDLFGKYLSRINMREGNEFYGGPFDIKDYTVSKETNYGDITYSFNYKRPIGIMGTPELVKIGSKWINEKIGRMDYSGDSAYKENKYNFVGDFKEKEKAQLDVLLTKHKELLFSANSSTPIELVRIQNGKLQTQKINTPEILSIEKQNDCDFIIYLSEDIHDAIDLKRHDYLIRRSIYVNIGESDKGVSLPDIDFYKIGNIENDILAHCLHLFFQNTCYENISVVNIGYDFISFLADQKEEGNKDAFSLLRIPNKSILLKLYGDEWTVVTQAEIERICPEEGIGIDAPAFFFEKPSAEQINNLSKSFVSPNWCEDQLKAMSRENLLQLSEITLRNPLFYSDRRKISQAAIEIDEERPNFVRINVEPGADMIYSMELIKIKNRWCLYLPSQYFEEKLINNKTGDKNSIENQSGKVTNQH
jgi:hypothetical protein